MSLSLKQLKPQVVVVGDVADVEGVLEKQKVIKGLFLDIFRTVCFFDIV